MLETVVRRTLDIQVIVTNGANASESLARTGTLPGLILGGLLAIPGDDGGGGGAGGGGGGAGGVGDAGTGEPPRLLDPPITDWWGYKKCCVRHFAYPASGPTRVPGKESIAVRFTAEAEFIDGVICRCECCEFEQIVNYLKLNVSPVDPNTGGPSAPDRPDTRPAHQDCLWVCRTKSGEIKQVKGKDKPTDPDLDCYGPFCLGTRELAHFPGNSDPNEGMHDRYTTHGDTEDDKDLDRASGCFYDMDDEPGGPVPEGFYFTFAGSFTGRIVDACHRRHLVTWGKVGFYWSGIMSDGKAEDEHWEPDR